MVDIPQCKEGHARLPISIEPNAPRPGSYTVHFGGKGGAFNAAHIADLPQQINHINKLAVEKGFTGICEENGDLYVEMEAQAKPASSSGVVNLVQMFKDAEGQWKFFLATKNSIVPGKLESEGITLYKKGDYKGAKEIFDAALLKGEITTAAGMYYAGFNTLAMVELDLFLVGKSSLDYGDPVDPLTFRKIVMLWGAATTLSLSEKLILGDDDRFINMVRSAKFRALERLMGFDQISFQESLWRMRIREGRSRKQPPWPKDPERLHPGQLQKRMAAVEFDLKNHPNDTIHMEYLAAFYALAGRFAEAIDLAKKAIAMEEKPKGPSDPASIILRVSLSRDTDYADRYDYRRILHSLVEICRKAGHEYSKERIWALEKLRAHEKENFSLGEELAELYLAANDLEKAMDAAAHAELQAQEWVEDAEQSLNSAEGDKKTAADDYKEAKSSLARARNLLANIHVALYERNAADRKAADNLHRAVVEYSRALEIEPRNFDSLLGMAKAQASLGNYPAAMEAIEEGIRLKGADHNLMYLVFMMTISHAGFQQADDDIKDAFRGLAHVLRTSSESKRIAELEKPFRYAIAENPKDVKAWQGLGLALHNTSAQPEYKKKALEALTKAMDILAENTDVDPKAVVGKLSDNDRVGLLVALLTEATERNQLDTALQYLRQADFLERMEMNDEIPYDTASKGISRYEREFRALDKLLYLWVADPRLERLVNKLKWALLDELATKTDPNGSKVSNNGGSGTPSSPSSTPEPANGSPNASGPSEQSAAPELNTTVTLGSFDIDPDERSQTTSSTYSTAAAIRRRRNRARSTGQDAGNMVYGSGVSTFGARPAGQTNSTGVQVPMWLFRPGK